MTQERLSGRLAVLLHSDIVGSTVNIGVSTQYWLVLAEIQI